MTPNLTPIEGVEDFDSAREKPTTGGVRDGEAFALDTSGSVQMTDWAAGSIPHRLYWSDLDPFTQGYVEALFSTPILVTTEQLVARGRDRGFARFGFSDLAPSALAAILKDCREFQKTDEWRAWDTTLDGNLNEEGAHVAAGQAFYLSRNRCVPGFLIGPWPEPFATDLWTAATDDFPPLTPSLGDDGKVFLRVSA